MKLPKLEAPVHILTLPISKKEVQYRPFILKEEKNLLTNIDSKDVKESQQAFELLLNSCILSDDIDIKNLNYIDFLYLAIHIKIKSSGEVIDGKVQCEHCGKNTEFSINVEDSMHIINLDENTVCKVNNRVSFELEPLNSKMFFAGKDLSISDILSNSIKTVIFDEKVYQKNKDFTPEELKENILNQLTSKELENLSSIMDLLPQLEIEAKYICMTCGKQGTYRTKDITNFF